MNNVIKRYVLSCAIAHKATSMQNGNEDLVLVRQAMVITQFIGICNARDGNKK